MGANLKEVRDRMKSVQNTQQITKAMKMVSAAKLRRAQDAITQLRPYANKLGEILGNLAANVESESVAALSEHRSVQSALLVIITSNKGLCGAFNTNVIKAAVHKIENDYAHLKDNGQLKLVFIGKKGYDYFKNRYPQVEKVTGYVELVDRLTFEEVAGMADLMIDRFKEGKYDRMDIAYAEFKNAAIQNFDVEPFLPIPESETESSEKGGSSADYIFEPNEDELMDHLVPSILQTQLFKCILDTHASEHGARMTAMDKATDNASELLKELKINYNKARQEAITRELSEIVGGAAALEG